MNLSRLLGAWILFVLATGLLIGWQVPASAQAYCYIREFSFEPLSNGVQIKVKADGILSWKWENGSEAAGNSKVAKAEIRFTTARLGLDKTFYKIDLDPVSTAMLLVPPDAADGRGVVLQLANIEPARIITDLSEDRQSVYITVQSNRTVESVPRSAVTIAAGAFAVAGDSKQVSVQAVKADLHKVVAEVALKSGICVAVDDAVQRDISLNIEKRAPLDVIRGIAAGYGLALSSVGDVYMLSEGVPADLPTYRRSATASYPMKYLKAGDVKSLLPSFLFKYVHDNPQQNAVVVTAPSQMLDKISSDLRAIDLPPAMVMVECAVVELTDSRDFDLNFRWQYQSDSFDFGANTNTGDLNFRQAGAATTIVETPRLQAWLQALITKGRAEVQAHPSMAAVNGKSAEIFIGSQRFVKMTYLQSGVTQERIETVPVGVKLNIQPWTAGANEITTSVGVEVSNIVQVDPKTGVPRVSRRTASTTVRSPDGDTIVIGGLCQRQNETELRRIPLLSDIPLLGELFKGKKKGNSNTELLILLRPRLLDNNGLLPTPEDDAIRRRFLEPGDLGCPVPPEMPAAKPGEK